MSPMSHKPNADGTGLWNLLKVTTF